MDARDPRDDDTTHWLALTAAGFSGACRSEIVARGAAACLADAVVAGRSFDGDQALARARLADAYRARGGQIIGGPDSESLGLLAQRRRAPLCVFGRGAVALARTRPAVAVVGARDCTATGATWARRVAKDLAAAGAVVVSGGARGIDRVAHEAALNVGGQTIAVLGEPVRPNGSDERPLWLKARFDAAGNRCLAIAVHGPWVPMSRGLFAGRNHSIAALVDAVVIVEGGPVSGTRHTAAAALGLGVPVWCVPGDVETSATPNRLLEAGTARWLDPRNAASLVLHAHRPAQPTATGMTGRTEDTRGVRRSMDEVDDRDPRADAGDGRTVPHDPVLHALLTAGRALPIDDVLRQTGLALPDLLARVALLELDGTVAREGANLRVAPRMRP